MMMETETEPIAIVWPGYPPSGATRLKLIESVRLLMAKRDQDDVRARAEHADQMDTWRATIADRLLALIPALEAGEPIDLWASRPSIGFQSDFAPPRLNIREDTWLEDKLAALEQLPDGPVSEPVRRALMLDPMAR